MIYVIIEEKEVKLTVAVCFCSNIENNIKSATFGPFDRQVLIMNTDGRTYTLLENPVAMRLKKAGFIDDRRSFITQPTQEDLDAASEKEPGFFSNLMGGNN